MSHQRNDLVQRFENMLTGDDGDPTPSDEDVRDLLDRLATTEQERDALVNLTNTLLGIGNDGLLYSPVDQQRSRLRWATNHYLVVVAERVALQRQVDATRALAVSDLRALQAVRSVCMDTDGDYLDGDVEIPVGEVLRTLAETVGLGTLEEAALDVPARADRAGGAS